MRILKWVSIFHIIYYNVVCLISLAALMDSRFLCFFTNLSVISFKKKYRFIIIRQNLIIEASLVLIGWNCGNYTFSCWVLQHILLIIYALGSHVFRNRRYVEVRAESSRGCTFLPWCQPRRFELHAHFPAMWCHSHERWNMLPWQQP